MHYLFFSSKTDHQNSQMVIMASRAKTICGTVATISIVVAIIFLPKPWGWITLEIGSSLIVAYGCAGEWYLLHKKTAPTDPHEAEHHFKEKQYMLLVWIGLFIELVCLSRTIFEGFETDRKIAQANKIAEVARKEAREAGERTALIESTNNLLSLEIQEMTRTNLILRSNIIALEVKLTPRVVTIEQRRKFIDLLKDSPKGPVKVISGRQNSEMANYAGQIRQLLDDAGYGVTNTPTIDWKLGLALQAPIGEIVKSGDVMVLFYGGKEISWPGIKFTRDGGDVEYEFNFKDPRAIPAIIAYTFQKIGIQAAIQTSTNMVSQGEWGILVHDKVE